MVAETGHQADPIYRYSINTFTGDGQTIVWEISFAGGYLSRDHIKAIEIDLDGNIRERVIDWTSDFVIKINPPVPAGCLLKVYRDTPKAVPLSDFNDGAIINETNLDNNAKQAVFIAAEAIDQAGEGFGDVNNRAILVPVGEVAPLFPPRNQMKGKLVGVDLFGNIVPVGPIGDGLVIDTSMVSHDGSSLKDTLSATIADLALTTEQLAAQATAITSQGEQIIEQALSGQALTSRMDTLRDEHQGLVSVVDALEAITEGTTDGLATLVLNEQSQRITADQAMAATISLIGSKNGDNSAFVLDLDSVKVSENESLSDRLSYLEAQDANNDALISSERTARIAGDTAEGLARDQIAATLRNETAAAVATEAAARTSGDAAEAAARQTLAATLRTEMAGADATLSTAIVNEQNARINGLAAEAANREALATTLRNETGTAISAAIQAEQTARINGDGAEAAARTQLGVTLGNSINAQIQAEQTARAAADGALAATVSLIGAVTPDGQAFILDSNKVKVDGGTTFGQKLSGIETSIGLNSAAIASEQTARANAVSALASDISWLGTQVGSNAAAISAETTARTDAVNSLAQTVSNVSATVGGQAASINSLASAQADLYGRTSARWQVTAVAGGRAQLAIFADANGGAGVDIVGDVHIHGNLIVDGTVNRSSFDMTSLVKRVGPVSTGASGPQLLWSATLGQTAGNGSYLVTGALTLTRTIGRRTETLNGKPYYIDYLNDGGIVVYLKKDGNVIASTSYNGGTSAVVNTSTVGISLSKLFEDVDSSTGNVTVEVWSYAGSVDSGVQDQGDYYTRDQSGTYSNFSIADFKVKWTFI